MASNWKSRRAAGVSWEMFRALNLLVRGYMIRTVQRGRDYGKVTVYFPRPFGGATEERLRLATLHALQRRNMVRRVPAMKTSDWVITQAGRLAWAEAAPDTA